MKAILAEIKAYWHANVFCRLSIGALAASLVMATLFFFKVPDPGAFGYLASCCALLVIAAVACSIGQERSRNDR